MLNVLYIDIKNLGRTDGSKEGRTDGKSHILRWLHHLKTAAGGKDRSKKVMTFLPYNQETYYPLSSFEAPHESWYGQSMFKPCSAWLRWLWLGCLVTLCQAYYPQPMTMPSFYA